MCGIAAIFAARPLPLEECIKRMTAAVRHRGPDDEGFAIFPDGTGPVTRLGGPDTPDGVYCAPLAYSARRSREPVGGSAMALGHRRLAIIDLSPTGHQPMCTADGRIWVVYNGEIYNHRELRNELRGLGHRFVSHSDTEVLLYAYKTWGTKCVDRFNGMFAFVLIDRDAKRVFAARDRFGIKPLYVWRSPMGLVAMASEIKQFSVLPGWSAQLNGQRAYDFLNWGLLDHTEETLFRGIRQLRGGECVDCSIDDLPRDVAMREWYRLKPRAFSGDLKVATNEFYDLFSDAVRLRLRADVPVGSCLSGGIDSSSIVCLVNQLLRSEGAASRQRTYSACTDIERFSERRHIETVVAQTGVQAYYVNPPLERLFETLDELTWYQDEPFGSTSIYAQWHVFKLSRETGVGVLLDGQGADEMLAGYPGFFAAHVATLLSSMRWKALLREVHAAKQIHGLGLVSVLQYLSDVMLPEPIRQPLRRLAGKPSSAAPRWLNPDVLGIDDRDPEVVYGAKAKSVEQMAYALLTRTSVPMLLHWEDRNSMANSVEARLPFLDFRLAEFVMGLPVGMRISDAITKRVLREAMRGVLPESIRMRMDKMGFVTPEEVWIREMAPGVFLSELHRAIQASHGLLNGNALKQLTGIIAGQKRFSFQPWRMISFGRWMERFQVSL